MTNRKDFEFRKSSFSASQGECVEVASNVPTVTAVRDSKDPSGPMMLVGQAAWSAFLTRLQPEGPPNH